MKWPILVVVVQDEYIYETLSLADQKKIYRKQINK